MVKQALLEQLRGIVGIVITTNRAICPVCGRFAKLTLTSGSEDDEVLDTAVLDRPNSCEPFAGQTATLTGVGGRDGVSCIGARESIEGRACQGHA
jgi:hypothetical protein